MKMRLGVQHELDVYRKLGVDKIAWLGVPYKGAEIIDPNRQGMVNHWGVEFEKVEANANAEYGEVSYNPLLELDCPSQLESYSWPSPDSYDYEVAVREAKELSREFVTLGPWISLFEIYCSMRSLEEALMDTLAEPEFLHAALDRIASVQGEMVNRFLQAADGAVDMVFISDDLGSQSSLLMSPDAFEEFLFPRLKAWCSMIHSHGAKVFFHTDGASEPLIPRLIEAGIDVLNPIQHVCPGMDCKELKQKYGNLVIFHGGVENQQILPFGNARQVADETRKCLDELGPDGFIPCSCHFAQADTPLCNIFAFIETVHQYEI
ncbi:uroporphyrinogen decarboxylase family protein [Pontiella desulfatans]|nr:uroporphyrinogen decarboxylase family protein [Pontiella desulfatans]